MAELDLSQSIAEYERAQNKQRFAIYESPATLAPDIPLQYLMAAQGIFKRAVGQHFEACIPIAPTLGRGVAGLPMLECPTLIMKVDPIPAKWLRTVICHSRQACHNGFVETMYHFHWQNNQWQVNRPKQVGQAGAVQYDTRTLGWQYQESIVLEVHTHPGAAFFSSTDNQDEGGLRFYGVLGHLDLGKPDFALRLGVYGDYIPVPLTALFEDEATQLAKEVNRF